MELTTQEIKKLASVLDNFENETLISTGMKKINGGFAEAILFDYDESYFDIELRWGTHGQEHTENYKIDRNTYEIEEA